MIVGADAADDRTILDTSATLYGAYRLKRVYYSAFSPIPDASRALPLRRPAAGARAPALSGRLADALLRLRRRRDRRGGRRHAGARHRPEARLGAAPPRALPARRQHAPAARICCACRASAPRRSTASSPPAAPTSLRIADLARLHIPRNKALPFIVLGDHRPQPHLLWTRAVLPSGSNRKRRNSDLDFIAVIASEAKQSMRSSRRKSGLLRRFAPRNTTCIS